MKEIISHPYNLVDEDGVCFGVFCLNGYPKGHFIVHMSRLVRNISLLSGHV